MVDFASRYYNAIKNGITNPISIAEGFDGKIRVFLFDTQRYQYLNWMLTKDHRFEDKDSAELFLIEEGYNLVKSERRRSIHG